MEGPPSLLDLPSLSGNPFEIRPLSIGQAEDLIGRDDIVIECREHMVSASPRMCIISGARGSGRTSLLNAIASQTPHPFISHYWPMDGDPVKNMVTQTAAHFLGHNLPSVVSETILQLSEELERKDGPIPLIAFDLPYNVEVDRVIPRLAQIMQKMRALVVFTMLPMQLQSLDEGTLEIFDTPYALKNLEQVEIQLLADKRIARVARQRWIIRPLLLEKIHELTEGLPRAVIRTLRGLVDERRGMKGSKGSLERLVRWSDAPMAVEPENPSAIEKPPEQKPAVAGAISSIYEYGLPQFNSVPDAEIEPVDGDPLELQENQNLSDLNSEPSEYQEKEPPTDISETTEILEQEDIMQHPQHEITEIPDTKSRNIPEPPDGGFIWMEPGTEPPPLPEPPLERSSGGSFSGLHRRTNTATFEMPLGGDGNRVIDASQPSVEPQEVKSRVQIEPSLFRSEENLPDNTPVLATEEAVWTVDGQFEANLPPPVEERQEIQFDDHSIPRANLSREEVLPSRISFSSISEPSWETPDTFVLSYSRSLTQAEKIVLSASSVRDISPSDPEIQARLEVGRPRLSQIFNKLKRNGYLMVRKEGRTRYFRISKEASDALR
jgi:DNA-binding transcriptional ArsR family regulator